MAKLNLINVSSADNSLDSKKADKASVAASFAGVEKATDANSSLGSLNSKIDTNSASGAKTFTSLNGNISSLATSAKNAIAQNLSQINNLDITNDKINALRNLMHDAHYNTPKVIALATSLTSDIKDNKQAVASLDSAKEGKADAATALGSLQSSASNKADSAANSVAASAKTALAGVQASAQANKTALASEKGVVQSQATDIATLKDEMAQVVAALTAGSNK